MNLDRGYRKSSVPPGAKRAFEGVIFDTYQWEQELYDGSKVTFEKIVRPDTVVVFPILSDGRIVLVEDSQPGRDAVVTASGGRVEEGEMPESAARRELLEETGYAVESLEPLFAESQLTKMDWVIYGFIGRGARKVQEPAPDPGEKITERIVSFDEMVQSIRHAGKGLRRDFGNVFFDAIANPEKMDDLRKRFLG